MQRKISPLEGICSQALLSCDLQLIHISVSAHRDEKSTLLEENEHIIDLAAETIV